MVYEVVGYDGDTVIHGRQFANQFAAMREQNRMNRKAARAWQRAYLKGLTIDSRTRVYCVEEAFNYRFD
jgi:hypothetical protein